MERDECQNLGDNSVGAIGSLNDRVLLQRIIAGFVLHLSSKINFSAHLQDCRAFGWSLRNSGYPDLFKVKAKNTQEPFYLMNPNEEFIEIYDLYVELKPVWKNFSLKVGRQKISYGDNRIFGPGEWGNTGRWTWDAHKVSYEKGANFIEAFAGGTKIHDPEKISIPFTKTEFWGAGLYAHQEWKKVGAIEPFYALKTAGSADYARTLAFSRHWLGVRFFNNNLHHFVYDLTFAREFGRDSGKKIEAFGLLAKIGYQLDSIWARPILAIRESYASGGKSSDLTIKTLTRPMVQKTNTRAG
ncbi:MAG: alginate export family protein [Candidatus Saccharicenans sp.]|nr:alginate export family protein [Candidatus Saccharicenans sp.]